MSRSKHPVWLKPLVLVLLKVKTWTRKKGGKFFFLVYLLASACLRAIDIIF